MADWNYDDFEESPDGGSVTQAVNWLGAVMSLLLIAGLATWGWKLLVRDVTGVPVVRALEGPMRVAPDDPGGDAAAYQGLAVNRIAAQDTVEERIETVKLAPQPIELNEEDQAMGDMVALTDEDGEKYFEVVPAPVFGAEMTTAEVVEPEPAPSATDLAVAAALAGIDDIALVPASLTVDALGGAGPVRSPRPTLRPATFQVASLVTRNDAVLGERDPASIPAGTRLVQLGAYGSMETARIEWANAMSQFGDYMLGKDRVIQEAQSNGQAFYRLRAYGFSDLADARRFCSVLVAEGANCIPVVQQ